MSCQVTRVFELPVSVVFSRMTDVSKGDLAWPDVAAVEILSTITQGTGLRFRESRVCDGKPVNRIYEVTQWRQNEQVTVISETPDDTIVRTLVFAADGPRTQVTLTVERQSRSMGSLLKNLLGKVVESSEEASWKRDLEGVTLLTPHRVAS